MPMAEVAELANVTRSTLYRYYPTREALVLAVILARYDDVYDQVVQGLSDPLDPRSSLVELILVPLSMLEAHPLNLALLQPARGAGDHALRSEALVEAAARHIGPLLESWQHAGRVHDDLDPLEAVRWLHTVSLTLVSPEWRDAPMSEKRRFVEQYLVRAFVVTDPADEPG